MKIAIASFIMVTQFTFCVNLLLAQENADSNAVVTFNQVIFSEDFNRNGLSDPLQIISGQAAGVCFTKKGSDPNVFNSLMIRGISSEYSPGILYIIDGVYGASPELLLADDIESFEILKDAASTAMYGSQGSAGVIIIKTRHYQGDKKLSLSFNSFLSLNAPSKKLDLGSASEYKTFVNENAIPGFVDGGGSTDWQDAIFRTTISQTYNLNISGKIKKAGYQVSLYHQNYPGIVIGSDRKNTGLNLHLTHTALNNRLNLRASALASRPTGDLLPNYTESGTSRSNVFYQAFIRNPTDPIFQADRTTYAQSSRVYNYYNPLPIINYTTNTIKSKNLNVNLGANYRIAEGLDFDLNLGSTLFNSDSKFLQTPEAFSGNANEESLVKKQESKGFNLEAWLIYTKSFKQNHHLDIRIGYTNRQLEDEYHSHYITTGVDETSFSKQDKSFNSLVGQFEYNFKQRYFLSALANIEYSKMNMSGTEIQHQIDPIKRNNLFPALTLGWKIKNESFLNQVSFINDLTLKAGYGITGNAQGDYLAYSSVFIESDSLEMEKTHEVSLGLDIGLWKNRVSGSITYYERNTRNAITEIPLPVPPYAVPYTYENGAWYENKGFEINLMAIPIKREKIKWSTSLSYFHNDNKLVSIEPKLSGGIETGEFIYYNNYYTQRIQAGNAPFAFYLPVSAGHSPYGEPLFHTEDEGITNSIDYARKEFMGQPVPKYELGWINRIQFFEGFDLSFTLRYGGGYSIYNATRMVLSNRGFLPSLNVNQEGTRNYINGYSNAPLSDLYLEEASFLRIENITVSYTIKPKNMKMGGSMNVYAGANNLLTITNYTGFDPAGYNGGIDFFNVYPLAKSFVFGIRLIL